MPPPRCGQRRSRASSAHTPASTGAASTKLSALPPGSWTSYGDLAEFGPAPRPSLPPTMSPENRIEERLPSTQQRRLFQLQFSVAQRNRTIAIRWKYHRRRIEFDDNGRASRRSASAQRSSKSCSTPHQQVRSSAMVESLSCGGSGFRARAKVRYRKAPPGLATP